MAVQAKSSSDDEGKIFAILAYLLGIIGFLIVLLAKKDNKFAMYHAKQALMVNIAAIVVAIPLAIVMMVLMFIPFVNIVAGILGMLFWLCFVLCLLVLVVMGIIAAINLQMKPLPVIGTLAEKWFTF